MTPDDIKTIQSLLVDRVPCQSAREGVAIVRLANKLVAHFAKEFAPKPADAEPEKTEVR